VKAGSPIPMALGLLPPRATAALELGVADYRFVRRYLERQAPAARTLRHVDPLIRELTHYRDVIARKIQEVTS